MDIGIGLPATIPGVTGGALVESARRAERLGFSSLGTIDRLVYPNYEPLTALAAAAAVTESIRLATTVLLAPLRSAALLAKQAATVDSLSGGRLVLGLAVGGRADDYEAAGVDFSKRGEIFDAQIEEMKQIWAGEQRGFAGGIGPAPSRSGGPTLVLGGTSEAAVRRTVQHGDGWIGPGGGPDTFKQTADAVRAAWSKAGREGSPRFLALAYFSLGPEAKQNADTYLKDYYGFTGPFAEQIAAGAATSEEMVKGYIDGYQQVGCDELILFPCSADPDQVDLLAKAAGLSARS